MELKNMERNPKETMEGVWVWGLTEPVKVLTHEYITA